jgi:arylsulfatase A-like enzyme
MPRVPLLVILALCAASAAPRGAIASSTDSVRGSSARGVVLIIVDALRYDRVGASTPVIERFAKGASVFTAARSQAPWSLPSATSLFTSMHPSRHGMINRYVDFSADPLVLARLGQVRPEARTIGEVFREAGWKTAAFTGGAGFAGESGLSAGFDVYDDSPTFSGFDRTAPLALRWLSSLKPDDKFFLIVHGYDVHPYHPGRLNPEMLALHKKLREERLDGKPTEATEAQKKILIDSYDHAVEAMDKRLEPLLKELAEVKYRNTLVALLADHGEELFDRGGVDHGSTLYEELIHVPLIVRLPRPGSPRIDAPVRLVDLMPTLLDYAGVAPDFSLGAQMDGLSLRPLIEGHPLALDSFAETDFLLSSSLRSVVTRDGWKAVLDRTSGRVELYRLSDDPGERRDLAGEKPELAQKLGERLSGSWSAKGLAAEGVRRGIWKALRLGGRTQLYDLSADPYLLDDLAEKKKDLALDLGVEFARQPSEDHKPSEALRRKLREAGYW